MNLTIPLSDTNPPKFHYFKKTIKQTKLQPQQKLEPINSYKTTFDV